MTAEPPMILRPGYITKEMLEEKIGRVTVDKVVTAKAVTEIKTDHYVPKAPGMKYKHYAPKADLTMFEGKTENVVKKIRERQQLEGIAGNVFTKKIREIYEVKQKVLFHIALVGSIIITVGISVYYSYFNDFQPQGRYCLPMWIPLAVFITAGLSGIIRLFPEKARKPLVMAVCLMYFAIAMNATYQVIAVTYY